MRRNRNVKLLAAFGLFSLIGASAVQAASNEFKAPVRLEAGGKIIDTGERIAHSGPCLADFDGDGLIDLLVGDFGGNIEFFQNIGTKQQPAYAEGKLLEADGVPIKIKNW